MHFFSITYEEYACIKNLTKDYINVDLGIKAIAKIIIENYEYNNAHYHKNTLNQINQREQENNQYHIRIGNLAKIVPITTREHYIDSNRDNGVNMDIFENYDFGY